MKNTIERHASGGSGKRRRKAGGKKGADVIHVAFGHGGGRIPDLSAYGPPARTRGEPKRDPAPPPNTAGEPVTDLFTRREVAKLLGVSETRLRTLDKTSVVSPSGERGGRRAYTFQDLIALRATRELLAHHVKLRDVAKAVGALRQALPRVTRPLQELRIVSDGRRIVVRDPNGAFEPVTGQMMLDFQVTQLRDDVVRLLRPDASKEQARTAFDFYAQASALDEDPSTFAEAEALYRRALEVDPQLAIAYTNLGNIRFRQGDEPAAEALYKRALQVDPDQPEAHYNLGYVLLERGEPQVAVEYFEHALQSDPRFADAHFNLAMAYEQCGDRARARNHWKKYLELEPTGTWADVARDHL